VPPLGRGPARARWAQFLELEGAEEFAPDLRFAGIRAIPPPNGSFYFESFIQELLESVPT
jgi:hypothetical protein